MPPPFLVLKGQEAGSQKALPAGVRGASQRRRPPPAEPERQPGRRHPEEAACAPRRRRRTPCPLTPPGMPIRERKCTGRANQRYRPLDIASPACGGFSHHTAGSNTRQTRVAIIQADQGGAGTLPVKRVETHAVWFSTVLFRAEESTAYARCYGLVGCRWAFPRCS